MAIATMSFPHLLAPLHALWAWATRPRVQPKPRVVASRPIVRAAPKARHRPPLRVVRDANGRMVISGRMADVCAELDRLAAREAERNQRL